MKGGGWGGGHWNHKMVQLIVSLEYFLHLLDNWEKDKLKGSWWVGGPWSCKKPNEGVSVAKVRTGKLGRGRRWGSWEVGGPWGMDHTIPYHTMP